MKLLKMISVKRLYQYQKNNDTFFEIVLIAANDELVNYYLKKKINKL